jgi:alkylation response protein AidB-like acyl-CoA dehydrogenase
MDFELTAEQDAMRDSVRRMVDRDIQPVLDANDPDRPLPKAEYLKILKAAAAQGLTAVRIPESAGGSGLGLLEYGLMAEQVPPAIMLNLMVHDACITRLHAECPPADRDRLLPGLIAGERIGCTAATEPAAGSDPRGVRTRLRQDGDTLVLDGAKCFVTAVSVCDVAIVTCSEGADADGRNRLAKVFVEPEVSPFATTEIEGTGLRQGYWGEAVFEDCRIPAANRLGTDAPAMDAMHRIWLGNRPLLGLMAVHLAQKAFDKALEFAGVREQFGKPIGAHQLIQKHLSDMATAITASRLVCYDTLSRIDHGRPAEGASAMAKRFAIESCTRAATLAMEVFGGMGVSREAGLEQIVRDIRMLVPPDGTNEILTLIHGRELTGLSALR